MGKQVDLEGMVFGRLTVVALVPQVYHERKKYMCVCSCGKIISVISYTLTAGNVKSCGCMQRDFPPHVTHGQTKTRLYETWVNMKQRCLPIHANKRKNWSWKGVSVCEDWLKFENFSKWAHENGYTEKLTIDRIDNRGNYEPSNCRWATNTEQANNKTNNRMIENNGMIKTVAEWSRYYGIGSSAIKHRYNKGERGERLFRKTRKRKGEKE